MAEPSQEVIDAIRTKFPTRALRLVELYDGEETFHFVMTGPDKAEFKKLYDETQAALTKHEPERGEKLQEATEKAALAMIRWPARDEVKELFETRPLMVTAFAKELNAAAGANFEVRAKKL